MTALDWAERLVADMGPAPPAYVRTPEARDAVANAIECIRLEDEERRREDEWKQSAEYQALEAMYRAMQLSPTIEICKALLRGEKVPLDRLNADAVRRYGLK